MTEPSPEQVLALVQAVIRPGKSPLLLDADGRARRDAQGSPLFVSSQQAVASGRAFTVEPREGVIAVDVDTVDGELPSWLDQARGFCAEQGCNLVEVTSGGASGGRHLWIVLPVGWSNPEFADVLRRAVPGLQAKQVRHTQATRPPLSIHRSGSQPQLLSPSTVEAALAILGGPRPNQTAGLSEKVLHLLHHGVQTGSRDTALFSIALGFVNAGHDFDAYEQAVLETANKAGQKVREMPPAKRRPLLERKWTDACEQVREHPATGEHRRRQIEALQATAETFPFPGKHRSDRVVFRVLVELASLSYLTQVKTTHRQLALRARCSTKAVRGALGRLRGQYALISLVESGRGSEASRYQLFSKDTARVPMSSHLGGTMFSLEDPSRAFTPEGLHPAFGGRGLPAGAGSLWDAMDPEVQRYTVKQLQEKMVPGLDRDTIRQYLLALHSAGLVDRNAPRGHYWSKLPCLPSHLDRLAADNGNAERAQRQREQHELERRIYRQESQVERAPKSHCTGTKKTGEPCQSWALPTGPRTRAAHCRAHLTQDERLAWDAWRDAQAHPEHLTLAT